MDTQNNIIKEHHVLPTDDDPPNQQKLQLQRRRAWDKSPITLSRLTTCNRVKTTNPEYKNTQQDLTGWNLSFRLSRICKLSRMCRLLTADFYPTLPRKVGFCTKALSNYSLLVSEYLLSGFKVPTVISFIYLMFEQL